jgi:heat shock protein HslJ
MTPWKACRHPSRSVTRAARPAQPGAVAFRLRYLVSLVAYVAVLGSCSYAGPTTTVVPSSVSPGSSTDASSSGEGQAPGTTWVLESGTVGGGSIPLLPDHPITLVVTGSQLSGASTCNSYWADVERSDHAVRLTNIVTTTMDCGDGEVMAADEAYLSVVPLVTRIDDASPDRLILEGPGVRLEFRRAPLEGQGG